MRDLNTDLNINSRPQEGKTGEPPPMLSLIIPVYNLEDYISRCLDAIAEQAFGDFQIIAVDGGSDDETPERLAKRRIDEPRLTIIPEGRIGPGRARNIAVDQATGDYVWFIDGDDLIAPGCLLAISDRLKATRPDVLLINHEIADPNGDQLPGQDNPLLSAEHPDSFTVAERPSLLDLRLVSWNKIIRRDFLVKTGVQFLSAYPHEDVPVSCGLLLAASRLSVLRTVCYYQLDRPGSAMKAGDRDRHFVIFKAWRQTLEQARHDAQEGRGHVTAQVYGALFQRAIWHCSTILDTGGSGIGRFGSDGFVARADREKFFTEIWRLYRDYVPDGYLAPAGLRGIKFRLIANGWYPAYAALEPVNQMRMAALRRVR